MAWGKDTPKAVWGGEKPPWQRPRAAPPAGREANLTRLRCPLRAACGKEDETFDEQALFEHMQLFHLSQVRPLDKPKTNGTCLSTDPTPEELDDIQLACAKLWQLDHNRLQAGKDYTLNLQGGKRCRTAIISSPLMRGLAAAAHVPPNRSPRPGPHAASGRRETWQRSGCSRASTRRCLTATPTAPSCSSLTTTTAARPTRTGCPPTR